MTVPPLTADQRAEARRRSLEVRRQRARVKQLLGEGYQLGRFLKLEVVGGMRVRTLLLAIPGIGQKRSDWLMEKAGIPAKNTVMRCGPKQMERLLQLLG